MLKSSQLNLSIAKTANLMSEKMSNKLNNNADYATDEFLKSKNISELRSLVQNLEKETINKQLELQQMVGSKYHDFIQSGDAITMMSDKSAIIDEKLIKFWSKSNEIINISKNLLVCNNIIDRYTNDSDKKDVQKKHDIINCSELWNYIDKCDIYNASLLVIAANALCLGDVQFNVVNTILNDSKVNDFIKYNVSNSIKNDCKAVMFLKETIVDDVSLLLLDHAINPYTTATTYASYSIFMNKSKKDILQLFMTNIDTIISNEMNTDDNHNKIQNISASIKSIVNILQRAILDIHLLFFYKADNDINGLLSYYYKNFLNKLINIMNIYTMNQVSTDIFVSHVNQFNSCDNLGVIELESELRLLFDKWLSIVILKVTNYTNQALESMVSAIDVARFQQQIWQYSTTIHCNTIEGDNHTVDDNRNIYHESYRYNQNDWKVAAADLLQPKQIRRVAQTVSSSVNKVLSGSESYNEDPATLLWSIAFRAPFVRQVERLLRDSSRVILENTKIQLLDMLTSEGIDIDPNTLKVHINVNSANNQISQPISSRLYYKAEKVRASLEMEITNLVADIILPVQEGDPQCAALLSRVLLVQCSQLAGQIGILLRVISNTFNNELESLIKHKPEQQSNSSSLTPNVTQSCLLTGLLLVGRFVWLMKLNGRFFEEALNKKDLDNKQNFHLFGSSNATVDLISEDQLRSAFEIADTDGDGIVTCSEAIEAVQALAVNPNDSSNTSTYASLHLLFAATPSLKFAEFTLLCAHLTASESFYPSKRFKECLEDLLTFCHQKWSEKTIKCIQLYSFGNLTPFCTQLHDDYGITFIQQYQLKNSSISRLVIPLLFKSSWRQELIEIDSGDSVKEKVLIPTSTSNSIFNFLFKVNQCITAGIMSLDTIQPIVELHKSNNGENSNCNKLVKYCVETIYQAALKGIAEYYTGMLRDIVTHNGSIGGASTYLEDCALQAIFDLTLCDIIATKSGITPPKSFKLSMTGWKSKLDPINAELTAPYIVSGANSFINRTRLLLPGNFGVSSIESNDTTNSMMTSNTINEIFSKTNSNNIRFGYLPLPTLMSNDTKFIKTIETTDVSNSADNFESTNKKSSWW